MIYNLYLKGHLEYVATTRILQPFFYKIPGMYTSYTIHTVQVGKRSREASIVLKAVLLCYNMNTPLPLKLFLKNHHLPSFFKKKSQHIIIQVV